MTFDSNVVAYIQVSHGTYCGCAICKAAAGVGTRWEDVLSLGEQQKIGVARMLYHSPAFGVMVTVAHNLAPFRLFFLMVVPDAMPFP